MKSACYIIAFLFCIQMSAYSQDSMGLILPNNPISDIYTPSTLSVKSMVVPTVLIGYGFVALNNHAMQHLNASTKNELQEDNPFFRAKIDNYLQYSPALAVYGLSALGIQPAHNLKDRTVIVTAGFLLSSATVTGLKTFINVERPDGSGRNSFPSGHTATAFAMAEFLHQEYKHRSAWYGIAGYLVAASTGAIRLYNNKHWFNDIVAGAGIGILSTKMAYFLYPKIVKHFPSKKKVIDPVSL